MINYRILILLSSVSISYYNHLGNLFIADDCICSGKANEYDEGSECGTYEGYDDEWYNGVWCYAATDTCSDAREHPDDNISGYGASHAACNKGKYIFQRDNWFG